MRKKIIIFISLAAATAVMATPWRDLFFETSVCLRVAPEAPVRQPEKKNNVPTYICMTAAIMPEKIKVSDRGPKGWRNLNFSHGSWKNFFGKNKFSSPSANIGRRRKI